MKRSSTPHQPMTKITLTEYLTKVSEYWEKDGTVCHNCDMSLDDEPGYCRMLHDRKVPDGDCAGLLAREGLRQPYE